MISSKKIFIEDFQTTSIVHVGNLVSLWEFLKIKNSSSFNTSYHTSAKMNCTKFEVDFEQLASYI
uniref:Uncharacterized protein MANES_16G102700 n=1 Tax=Rhizophora mucronata TaxID=61149 RepID=A0A2P2KCB0_RHIMU